MTEDSNSAIENIRLDQLLQLIGVAETGGRAKLLIQAGEVFVNGEMETRRRRKLSAGDTVEFDGNSWLTQDFLSGN